MPPSSLGCTPSAACRRPPAPAPAATVQLFSSLNWLQGPPGLDGRGHDPRHAARTLDAVDAAMIRPTGNCWPVFQADVGVKSTHFPLYGWNYAGLLRANHSPCWAIPMLPPSSLRPGRIVRGANLPDPVEVLALVAFADSVQIIRRGLQPLTHEPGLMPNQLAPLTITADQWTPESRGSPTTGSGRRGYRNHQSHRSIPGPLCLTS